MGGGVSLIESVEELMTTTILIGRAISAITFPGMYRIYDFHSKRAPRLKNAQPFTFFAPDSDDENDDDEGNVPDPSDYEHLFHVMVGNDIIYLEDPLQENEAGWTPLHTCCMSLTTVQAGLELIAETARKGGSFETRTKAGPGTFNKGWTPLQMACAYGAEPIVEALVKHGADVNATNSFGFSCIHEACHRGYYNVVKYLVSGPINLSYIPAEEDALSSPFSSAPSQTPLGEAARCGFYKIVELLLESGAPKDLPNRIGWTALHEACFYNRMETVKILLLNGVSPTARTRLGALPYHLAGLSEIRTMLQTMGGEGAVPSEGDVIDMVEILNELMSPESYSGTSQVATGNSSSQHNNNPNNRIVIVNSSSDVDDDFSIMGNASVKQPSVHEKHMPTVTFDPKPRNNNNHHDADAKYFTDSNMTSEKSSARDSKRHINDDSNNNEDGDNNNSGNNKQPLLHSGPLLGDLPSLTPNKSPSKKLNADLDRALLLANNNERSPSGLFGSMSRLNNNDSGYRQNFNNNSNTGNISRKADGKEGGKKKKPKKEEVPKDCPPQYICQLTNKIMSEPMKTIYGNVYDKSAIMNWLQTQGRICPLTGAPLGEIDLSPLKELGEEIRQWVLNRSKGTIEASNNDNNSDILKKEKKENDDLYDF